MRQFGCQIIELRWSWSSAVVGPLSDFSVKILARYIFFYLGFQTHYTGHLSDDVSLRLLYSAADAIVIPSRQDNLPNTGLESMACGTPEIAFDAGG
jgi:glycosyltransferase involved in cell wall biosynthesis